MIEFFCPNCEKESLDSFAVGLWHGRKLKCDFCQQEFCVSIEAVEQSVQADGFTAVPNSNLEVNQTVSAKAVVVRRRR